MTKVFNFFSTLSSTVASIVGVGSTPMPTIPVGANLNCLQLDTHFLSQHKTFIYGGNSKVQPLSYSLLGTPTMLQNYHYTEILKPIYLSSEGNQWIKYKGTVDMCCDEYLQIKDNNYATYQGNTAKLISVKWNPYMQTAEIEFWVNKKYTTNLKVSQITPNSSTIIL
jgi:hypothetical protein